MPADRRFAVLIDADNVSDKYIKIILDEVSTQGVANYKRIYGNWTSPTMASWKNVLLDYSVTPIQQYSYTTGKNATDSAMIIDAMDILYSGKVEGFCLVSSDSDFTRLASRLREGGMTVIGMGEKKTPKPFIAACNMFRYLDVLAAQPEAEPQPEPKAEPAPAGEEHLRRQLMGELACEALLGNSSPLYARLYSEGLINKNFGYGFELYPGCALMAAGGESCDPRAVRDAVLAEGARIAQEGVDEGLFRRLKKGVYGAKVRGLNSFENVCIELAQAHFAGVEYLTFPEVFDGISKADVEDCIRRWVTPERCGLAVVRPGEEA